MERTREKEGSPQSSNVSGVVEGKEIHALCDEHSLQRPRIPAENFTVLLRAWVLVPWAQFLELPWGWSPPVSVSH